MVGHQNSSEFVPTEKQHADLDSLLERSLLLSDSIKQSLFQTLKWVAAMVISYLAARQSQTLTLSLPDLVWSVFIVGDSALPTPEGACLCSGP